MLKNVTISLCVSNKQNFNYVQVVSCRVEKYSKELISTEKYTPKFKKSNQETVKVDIMAVYGWPI